jgi:hypothetical protein
LHSFTSTIARVAAMASPRSEEVKLGVEKPVPEEVRWCELKPKLEIKRTARIRCEGRVPTGPIASCHHVKEEKVSTPVRRSERLRGMKRKDYKETPESKDYGGSDYPDDHSPSSWAAVGREDNDLFYWEEVPKEPTPEGPNGGGDPDGDNGSDPGDNGPFREHPMCCAACRHIGIPRIGRRVLPSHESNEAKNGGLGARSQR